MGGRVQESEENREGRGEIPCTPPKPVAASAVLIALAFLILECFSLDTPTQSELIRQSPPLSFSLMYSKKEGREDYLVIDRFYSCKAPVVYLFYKNKINKNKTRFYKIREGRMGVQE